MKIIQTINGNQDFKKIEKHLCDLLKTEVCGIRVNLCKYANTPHSEVIINKIAKLLKKYENRYEFMYDIPFPKSKTRIIDFSINENKIIKGERYTLTTNSQTYAYNKKNTILTNTYEFNSIDDNIIYFGDGEGAFKVLKYNYDEIIVVACNSFEIFNNKAITLGLNNEIFPSKIITPLLEYFDIPKLALSFVDSENEIIKLQKSLSKKVEIISKIETNLGVKNISHISQLSDAIMIARGDLTFYSNLYNFLDNIRDIIAQTNSKDLYFATDILTSLRHRFFPSRADIVDVLLMKELGATGLILPYSNHIMRSLEILKQLKLC